ncbi:dockerin type I repeat-containing protein [Gemmatimonas aurantiaca]|nr:dockerin type I repeat-containing protein [Gemmatimonas aurantiaca]
MSLFEKLAKLVICVAIYILCSVATHGAEPPFDCADFNSDGTLNIGDVSDGLKYLYNGGIAPTSFDSADYDGALHYTINDASGLVQCIFSCDGVVAGSCTTSGTPVQAPLDETIVFQYDDHVPANTERFGIRVGFKSMTGELNIAQIPLQFFIDGIPAQVDSLVLTDPVLGGLEIRDSGIVIIANFPLWGGMLTDIFARVWVTAPVSSSDQPISAIWRTLTPHQAPSEQNGSLIPFFRTSEWEVGLYGRFTPALEAGCCFVPGDSNSDGAVTIADVIFGISRIFTGGPVATCPAAADANADGTYNIGDATYLISYIFTGGPAPVCGP